MSRRVAAFVIAAALSQCVAAVAREDAPARRPKALVQILKRSDPPNASNAAGAIGNLGCGARTVFPDLVTLGKERKNIRSDAIYAIGLSAEKCKEKLGGLEVVEAAQWIATNTVPPEPANVREVAAYALGRLAGDLRNTGRTNVQRVISALIAGCSDGDVKVQRAATEALSQLQENGLFGEASGDIVDALAHALEANNGVRSTDSQQEQKLACGTLQSFGPVAKRALSQLEGALNSANALEDPEFQRNCVGALAKIGHAAAPAAHGIIQALKNGNKEVQKAAAWALGQIKPAADIAVPSLITALDDASEQVRVDAQSALQSYVDDPSAIQILIEQLPRASSRARPVIASVIVKFSEVTGTRPDRRTLKLLVQAGDAIKAAIQASAVEDAASLRTELSKLQDEISVKRPGFWSRVWRDHATALWIGIAAAVYLSGFFIMRFVVLRFWPLRVLAWNEALTPSAEVELPPWLLKVKIPLKYLLLFGFFHESRQVLDEWVEAQTKEARKRFTEMETVRIRRTYMGLPVEVEGQREPIPELTPCNLHGACSEDHWCIRILGEGGAGKTTLACRIALWGMEDGAGNRLCPNRRMLPILLESGVAGEAFTDSTAFKKLVLGSLRELTGLEEPVSDKFAQRLLRTRRVLLILDGLSEIDATALNLANQRLTFSDPDCVASALLITSRTGEIMNVGRCIDIRPLRIDSNHLSPFINAYLSQAGISLSDTEIYENCTRLARMVGQTRGITPLLAKMYAEALIGFHKTGRPLEGLPTSVPELFLAYLNELNRAPSAANPGDPAIHAAAKRIAWNA